MPCESSVNLESISHSTDDNNNKKFSRSTVGSLKSSVLGWERLGDNSLTSLPKDRGEL